MLIEYLRSEGKSEDEIRLAIQEMKTLSIDKYMNRQNKIGEIITSENKKLLCASADAMKRRGPHKLRNISVDYNNSHKVRK